MVAQFHDEPIFNDTPPPPSSSIIPITPISIAPQKTNPLAKNKSKNNMKNLIDNRDTLKIDYFADGHRQSSLSSDDIDVPIVNLKTIDTGSDEFDCWLSDTNQRRSPEGGEDLTSPPSINREPIQKSAAVTIETLTTNDDALVLVEKKHKSKKKKDKKDRDERSKEKKKKRKSKENDLEAFLNGTSSGNVVVDDSAYEAI